ncbi:MAG: glycosyltransferase [Floccifex sp.]
MSIYRRENPAFLRDSLESLFIQTFKPSEIVIVEDGTLTDGLYSVLNDYMNKYCIVKRVKLNENHGLGYALRIGLDYCTSELVARMDSDDICKPNRFEVQVKFMESHPEVDVLGSWIDEFYETKENVVSVRRVPENSKELYEFSKKRNPMNHPTVMFRKSSVLKAGGYQTCMLLEDYYLWARMFKMGMVFHNIQEPLLYFRLSRDIYKRRGGVKYAITEVNFQVKLYKIGYLTIFETIRNIASRFFVRLLPISLRRKVYSNILR